MRVLACFWQVSFLATEVFCKGDGFQPVVKLRKLAYKLELYARLGWRVNKLNSCFAVTRLADPQHDGRQV